MIDGVTSCPADVCPALQLAVGQTFTLSFTLTASSEINATATASSDGLAIVSANPLTESGSSIPLSFTFKASSAGSYTYSVGIVADAIVTQVMGSDVTANAANIGFQSGVCEASQVSAPASGTVYSIAAYLYRPTSHAEVISAAIYDSTGTLLGSGSETVRLASSFSWFHIMLAGVKVTQGSTYWLLITTNDTAQFDQLDMGSATSGQYSILSGCSGIPSSADFYNPSPAVGILSLYATVQSEVA